MIASARIPGVTLQQLAAEIDRELGSRAALYPKRVDAMRMTQAEADAQIAIARAWRADVARIAAWRAGAAERWARKCAGGEYGAFPAPEHGIDWRTRRQAVERELELRARFYPDWIASGRLAPAAAAHQVACLEALREIYDEGWDWPGDTTSPDWSAHYAAVEARRHPPKQEAMAL
jgi:hypothetical protein